MPTEIYVDRSRAKAMLITAAGNVYDLNNIEQFQTSKTESGDAGTFSITMSLGLNMKPAMEISPMDIIAIYRARVSTSVGTNQAIGPVGNAFPQLAPATHKGLAYGGANAAVTKLLQSDSCVMIGMVDDSEEDQTYEGQPTATFTIIGRDLTKVFLDNDTFVPYTVLGSSNGQGGLANLGNIVIRKDQSGTKLLKNILNVFCKKDPSSISGVAATTQDNQIGNQELQEIASYGYAWDNFVDQTALVDGFESFSNTGQNFPNFEVQSGSVWANVQELRNTPLTRLFVNEIGQLIFDDQYDAWTNSNSNPSTTKNQYAATITIQPGDLRQCKFKQTDEDMATVMSVQPALMGMADTQIASLTAIGAARRPSSIDTVQHYGYRWLTFQSEYDTATDPTTIESRFKVLWLLHNSLWRATVTVRGDSKYRVGKRVVLNTGGANSATQFKTWYIVAVSHNYQFGSDDTTQLELRYPM